MRSAKAKILHIITYLELGGAQKHLFYLLEDLPKDKYSLHLIAGDKGYLKEKFLKIQDVDIKLLPWLVRNINPIYDVIAFIKIYRYIKKEGFDIVHTHSPKASILGRWAAYFAGVKNIIYTAHGLPFHKFMNPFAYWFFLFLEKITAKITRKIIVVSRSDKAICSKNKICQQDKISLIHYGIDIDKFINSPREKKESHNVITISSLKKQKGIFDFLRVAKSLSEELPQLKFFIIGDGPLRKKVQRTISKMALEDVVMLQGFDENVDKFLKKAKVFLLTSLWEGLPIALIEALAWGVPVVVSDTGGVNDILENDKGGFIIRPKDIHRFKEACLEVLKNPDKWSKIMATFRQGFDLGYWSKERMLKQITDVYENS